MIRSPLASIEDIASICHEANRQIQITQGDPSVSPHWDVAPEWQKASALEGVSKALEGATPEQLHESWAAFKVNDGWTYGEVKDAEVKTHPCLVPYSELPVAQLLKDSVFSAIVTAMSYHHT